MFRSAVISEALFTIFAKRLSGKVTPFQMATGVNAIGFLLFLPFAIVELLHFDLGKVSLSIWLLIVYYAVTASVLSFVLWYFGVGKVRASTAGLFTGVMPISAALVSVLFLGEEFTWSHGVGMALVLASIYVGTKLSISAQGDGVVRKIDASIRDAGCRQSEGSLLFNFCSHIGKPFQVHL